MPANRSDLIFVHANGKVTAPEVCIYMIAWRVWVDQSHPDFLITWGQVPIRMVRVTLERLVCFIFIR